MYLCAFVGSLLPPPPARLCPLCLSLFGVLFAFFFLGAPLVAVFAAHARPACAPCSSLWYPCLAAPCPLPRLSPLLSAVSLRVLSVNFPTAITAFAVLSLVCATRVLSPCPSLSSLPFSLLLTYLCAFASFPDSLLIRDAMGSLCGWGGGLLADWIVALLLDG